MRVVSYNIRFGGGRRAAFLAEVIDALAPDVLLLQEATNPSVVDALAQRTGLAHALHQPGWSAAALLRVAPVGHRWHRLGRGPGVLEVVPGGQRGRVGALRFVNVHLSSGLSRRGERRRIGQVEELVAWLGGGVDDGTIVAGDLNAIAPNDVPRVARMPFWLRMLLRFDGGIRTDVMTRLATAGWVDAYRSLHPGEAGGTMPAGAPQVRLDYALVPPAVLPRIVACEPMALRPTERASDHLPLLLVIAD